MGIPFPNLAWTPDGRWLAFGGALSPDGPRGIWLVAADGKENQEPRQVTEAPRDNDMGDFSPVPSPDGTHMAFIRERTFSRGAVSSCRSPPALPAGSAAQLTPESWNVNGVAWTADGRDLLFSWGGHLGQSQRVESRRHLRPVALAFRRRSRLAIRPRRWQFRSPGGSSTARNSETRRYTRLHCRGAPISRLPVLAFPPHFDEGTPHYSPDGTRIAFSSTRSGVEEIWIANRDGTNPQQVTSFEGPQCSNPQWSPNGRSSSSARVGRLVRPVYASPRNRRGPSADDRAIGRKRSAGRATGDGSISDRTGRAGRRSGESRPMEVSEANHEVGRYEATESPDRRYLYYAKDFSSPGSIWRVPVEGGTEERIAEGLSDPENFVVGDRGLYFLAVGDARHKTSIDFLSSRPARGGQSSTCSGRGVRHGVVARWPPAVLAGEQRGEQSHARRQLSMRAMALVIQDLRFAARHSARRRRPPAKLEEGMPCQTSTRAACST